MTTPSSRSRGRLAVGVLLLAALGLLAVPATTLDLSAGVPSLARAAVIAASKNPCHDSAVPRGLELPAGGSENAYVVTGPNYTARVCSDVTLRLTTATYPVVARACLQPSRGGPMQCGAWTPLGEPGEWEELAVDVLGDTKWQLQMYSEGGAQSVGVEYTSA
ncbi:hypothetical protein GCM10010472_71710 [Pseudonocardia halophobica]|uniref:Uncharacterized protein n=1 Tax=Pseudonocardia halophobica TaxID=29401 RepID=A0A9W6L123_9PSEU|nr:hypothetical protein [Pseudonocardia halophobica]GLL10957.1 hypothetical protein GCM10017577_20980 [Pseudonocardia halophobica]